MSILHEDFKAKAVRWPDDGIILSAEPQVVPLYDLVHMHDRPEDTAGANETAAQNAGAAARNAGAGGEGGRGPSTADASGEGGKGVDTIAAGSAAKCGSSARH